MVFGVFSPGRTQCIAPKKLPDKAMSIWNLHKKFQLSSAMGLRDFDLQSQPTLMGGNPLIVVHWSTMQIWLPLAHKRALNLLGGVNQGSGLLLARGLEKGQSLPLVNTLEKIECSLISCISPRI